MLRPYACRVVTIIYRRGVQLNAPKVLNMVFHVRADIAGFAQGHAIGLHVCFA